MIKGEQLEPAISTRHIADNFRFGDRQLLPVLILTIAHGNDRNDRTFQRRTEDAIF